MAVKKPSAIETRNFAKSELIGSKAKATAVENTTEKAKPAKTKSAISTGPSESFANKIRGAINDSRLRRAERAIDRGDKERSDALLNKVKESESKMKKGGSVNKMLEGGTSSTKTNMFGKTKDVSKAKAERIGTRFATKSKHTFEDVGDGESYTIKPRENSKRSVTTTFKKVGGAVKKPLAKAQMGKTVKTKPLSPAPKPKTGMDALKALGQYVSTFGFATEGYNPAPKKTAVKTKKK
jgi:hypothetical protein